MPGAHWLTQILEIVANVFDAHTAAVFLGDGTGCRLSGWFSLSDKIQADVVITPGKGVVGLLLRDHQPLLITNFDQTRGVLGYYGQGEEARIKAFMGHPLEQGALVVDSKKTYSFGAKEQKILSQFAALIHSFLAEDGRHCLQDRQFTYYRSLKLLFELRGRLPRWSAFLGAVLQLVAEAAGFSHCLFASRDATGSHYAIEGENKPFLLNRRKELVLPIATGGIGWVFREGRPLLVDERDARAAQAALFGKEVKTPPFKSLCCLPILIHRKTRGVLVLADEEAREVDQELKDFLTMVADHLALFLENLYLKNRLTAAKAKV